jgi:hypothetical protein
MAIAGHRSPVNSGNLSAADVDLLATTGPVGIVGQASPGIAMSKESDVTKRSMAYKLVTGLKKHLKASDKLWINGVEHTRDELIAFFDEHTAALDEKRDRYAMYRSSVARERRLSRRSLGLYKRLHTILRNLFGPEHLGRFGMKEHKRPGPKTIASKLAGVRKRAKKRAAK